MAHASDSTDSADEIPPLAFDSEEELRAVLDRLRGDLEGRVEQQAAGDVGNGKGKGKAAPESEHDRKLASDLVLKHRTVCRKAKIFKHITLHPLTPFVLDPSQDFYAKMEAIIVQNCTITGLSWSEYQRKKRKGELGKTQPFDDNLHQRVLKYQNDLFDAREINARERVDAPARNAQYVEEILRLDSEHAEQLERARIEVPDEIALARPRSRKSLGGAGDAPSAAQAQEYYEEGRASLEKLLADVPKLASAAEEARKVALDAANLR